MIRFARRFLSHDCGPFAQFVKYGAVGVMATCVQLAVFYVCASFWLKCLAAGDPAVVRFGLPYADFTGQEPWYASRGMLAAVDTAVGFTVANVFCWLMNRAFVFVPGRHSPVREFAMFFAASAAATFVALGVMKLLIDVFGVATTYAVVVEVAVSFMVNFAARKFLIFKR